MSKSKKVDFRAPDELKARLKEESAVLDISLSKHLVRIITTQPELLKAAKLLVMTVQRNNPIALNEAMNQMKYVIKRAEEKK